MLIPLSFAADDGGNVLIHGAWFLFEPPGTLPTALEVGGQLLRPRSQTYQSFPIFDEAVQTLTDGFNMVNIHAMSNGNADELVVQLTRAIQDLRRVDEMIQQTPRMLRHPTELDPLSDYFGMTEDEFLHHTRVSRYVLGRRLGETSYVEWYVADDARLLEDVYYLTGFDVDYSTLHLQLRAICNAHRKGYCHFHVAELEGLLPFSRSNLTE